MKPKLLVLSIHPAPYRDPTFYEVFRRSRIDLEVIFYFPLDVGHKEWGWKLLPFPSKPLSRGYPLFKKDRLHLTIFNELMKNRYHIVLIPGYSRATSLLAISYCTIFKIPFILNADSFHISERIERGNYFKKIFRNHILKTAKAIWVPGKGSRQYFEGLGIRATKIFEGGYCFDSVQLQTQFEILKNYRLEIRRQLNISEQSYVFLTVGNLIKNRNYIRLLNVFKKIQRLGKINLIIIGDGPERLKIESLIKSLVLRNIRLIPSVTFHELPKYYVAADAYVHAGFEPFSTSTEIAAIFGLPIVATKGVGYVYDLIYRGVNPLLSDIGDESGLEKNLQMLVSNPEYGRTLGREIKSVAMQRSVEWAAEQLENAVIYGLSRC